MQHKPSVGNEITLALGSSAGDLETTPGFILYILPSSQGYVPTLLCLCQRTGVDIQFEVQLSTVIGETEHTIYTDNPGQSHHKLLSTLKLTLNIIATRTLQARLVSTCSYIYIYGRRHLADTDNTEVIESA